MMRKGSRGDDISDRVPLPRGQESVSRNGETPDVGGKPEYMGKLQTDTAMEYTESERNDGICYKKCK